MHIAIITPAYDVAPYISDTINSVLAQTHRDWSHIIVDDGSSDATADIVGGFTDLRIRLIRQPRAGVSAARNRGISVALPYGSHPTHGDTPHATHGATPHATHGICPCTTRGDTAYAARADAVIFLDADDWLAPAALQDLSETLADAPWAVAACARYVRVHIDGVRTLSAAPPDGVVLDRLLTRNLFANGGHLLIAADAIDAVGAFRTDLHYGEDWEYWCRLALLGKFAAVRTRRPALFLREREGSACHGHATRKDAYLQALDAIHSNPALNELLGRRHLAQLRGRAEAEIAWAVGRELIRHGSGRDGRRWLLASLTGAPTLKRACMLPLSLAGAGPFKPYRLTT